MEKNQLEEMASIIKNTWLPIMQGADTVGETRIGERDAIRIANRLTEANYVKQVEAEWCPYTEYYADDYSECNTRKVFACSRCGRLEKYKEPYCNCGAKMKVGD